MIVKYGFMALKPVPIAMQNSGYLGVQITTRIEYKQGFCNLIRSFILIVTVFGRVSLIVKYGFMALKPVPIAIQNPGYKQGFFLGYLLLPNLPPWAVMVLQEMVVGIQSLALCGYKKSSLDVQSTEYAL
ncbi:MAG: hypothetical protein B6247_00315 [Candidatus Parabeggiatoa sp. nov. 2]|nr:MAG: hypothetical protein B6247_00315 [Beggiatoa sp. 4572_84]